MSAKTRKYGRKTTYRSIKHKRDMGLNNEVCKHKVAYCTLKGVFLNEEQVCKKFCRCKKTDKETGKTKPCPHIILKNEKPEKFAEYEKKSQELHAKKKKVDKTHMVTIKGQVKGGEYKEYKMPICLEKKLSNEKSNPNKCFICTYGNENVRMSERLCKERRCLCGKFGKITGEPCPYLIDKRTKPKKKKQIINPIQKNPIGKVNDKDFYIDENDTQPELQDDEIMILGTIMKKSDLGL